MILKTDCKYFIGDRPCKFSKAEGVMCNDCGYYSPVKFKIIIIKLDALGDVLRTTSLLSALKKQHPDSFVTWVTMSDAKDVFKNNPNVDELLFYENTFTTHKILNEKFDLLIHPDASPTSAAMATTVNAKEKRGYVLNEMGKVVPANKEAETWLEMGVFDQLKKANSITYQEHIHRLSKLPYEKGEIQLFLNDEEENFAKQFSEKNNLSRFKTLVGLNTGASKRWQLKQWRDEGFVELIEKLQQHKDVGILLYGGEEEKEKNDLLKKKFPNVIDTGSNNSLRQFFALMSLPHIVLTGDTMALHVATAFRKKVICYFGPTSANEIEDYGRMIKIQPDMDCLVCYKQQCDFNPNCMQLISSGMINDAVIKSLEN